MLSPDAFQIYQHRLVDVLQRQYQPHPRTLEAFAAIPRHLFLNQYWIYDTTAGQWKQQTRERCPDWYEIIYQDEYFITQIDQNQRPLSSSSQPGIMATMLDAVDLQPGMKVLEVGTATGYNAALLAHLAGDPHLVTTLDVLPVDQAQLAITEAVGEGMTILQGDGRQGYVPHAPYERIMVTAATGLLPWALSEQLAVGGVLVAIMQPRLSRLGGVLRAVKQEDGTLQGCLLCPASFMPLRDDAFQVRKRSSITWVSSPFLICTVAEELVQLDWTNAAFAFFLSNALPSLSFFKQHEDDYIFSTSPEGYARLCVNTDPHRVKLYGEPSAGLDVWNRLQITWQLWSFYKETKITDYRLFMDAKMQTLFIENTSGTFFPFPPVLRIHDEKTAS